MSFLKKKYQMLDAQPVVVPQDIELIDLCEKRIEQIQSLVKTLKENKDILDLESRGQLNNAIAALSQDIVDMKDTHSYILKTGGKL